MSKNVLYVTNLSQRVDEAHVQRAFSPFGDVIAVIMPKRPDQPTKHKGYALVEFADPADARHAMDNLHRSELDGEVITVQQAKPGAKDAGFIDATKSAWSQVPSSSSTMMDEAQ